MILFLKIIIVILILVFFYVVGFNIVDKDKWPPKKFRDIFQPSSILYLMAGGCALSIACIVVLGVWVIVSLILK